MFIEDFFNDEYVVFANYRTTQRLPNYDGLIETQRKVVYTFLELNKTGKEKTVTLVSDVMKYTHYNHGDKSVGTVINTLAASWGNNIPLLTEDGSFGYRSNNRAADSRYTYTRMREYLKVLFNPIDNEHFVDKKTDGDGNEIEPNSLIPILPLLVINGQNQIGVGFATKVLPRDPKVIIGLIKDILEKKTTNIPSSIAPWYWCFTGTIEPILNSSSWNINGLWSRGKNNTIIITEVPFKYDRDGYLKSLNDLKEPQVVKAIKSKKGEPKLEITPIISYKENINKNSFYLEVKVDKLIYDLPDNKLEDLLSLTSSESEFFTTINENNEIVSIDNIGIYLYNFIKWRLGIYAKRKAYLLEKMKNDILVIKEIVRFINLVNDNVIIIHKQSKANLIAQIEDNQFQLIDGSFNYVLNVKIYELTAEKIIDYLAEVDKLQLEHDRLEKVAISELWLEDIQKFEALFFKKEKASKVLKVPKPEKLEKPEKKTRTKKEK